MSSNIAQWQQDLALLPDIEMSQWQPFLHSCSSQPLAQHELASALAALGAVTGWLQQTAQVTVLREQSIPTDSLPLAGEFFVGDQYWQLTRLPRDRWQLHRHQLQPVAASEANCLGESVTQLQAGARNACLRYWKLWQPDADQAPSCNIALLTAIEESCQ